AEASGRGRACRTSASSPFFNNSRWQARSGSQRLLARSHHPNRVGRGACANSEGAGSLGPEAHARQRAGTALREADQERGGVFTVRLFARDLQWRLFRGTPTLAGSAGARTVGGHNQAPEARLGGRL